MGDATGSSPLIVGDRIIVAGTTGKVSAVDPDGKLLEQWTGYGKPTGIFLAKDDTLYVSDSLASWAARLRPDPKFPNLRAGWYVGSARDGMVKWFVPDEFGGPEDITADARGDVYTAEWGPQTIRKFILDPARVALMDKEPRQKSLGRE